MNIQKFFVDCFFEKNKKHWDLGRVLWALSTLIYLFLASMDVFYTHNFEYQEFGIGLAAVLAGGGLGLNLKKSSEPS